jgi:hypothetical protein
MSKDRESRLTTLGKGLAAATTAGAVKWHVREPDVYSWAAAEGAVSVASRDRDAEPPYELVLYNPEGEKVDELTSELVGDQPAPWNDALAELYRAARRSALHADDIIDALIGALPKSDGSPKQERSFLGIARRTPEEVQ